jgi:hypothetical protein
VFSGIETPIMANLAAVNVLPLIHTSPQDSDGHYVDKVSRYFLNQSNAPYLYPRSQRLFPKYVVFLITVHLTCKWTREYIPVGQEKMIKMNVYATIAIDIDIT